MRGNLSKNPPVIEAVNEICQCSMGWCNPVERRIFHGFQLPDYQATGARTEAREGFETTLLWPETFRGNLAFGLFQGILAKSQGWEHPIFSVRFDLLAAFQPCFLKSSLFQTSRLGLTKVRFKGISKTALLYVDPRNLESSEVFWARTDKNWWKCLKMGTKFGCFNLILIGKRMRIHCP